MKRKPIIAGNWKMHMNHLEALALVQNTHNFIGAKGKIYEEVEVVVCPPFTALRGVQTLIEADKIPMRYGAQNCHWESKGAYTGEVSPEMLAKLKCSYVIAGHSERRAMFGDTDETVNRKAKAIFAGGMTPIVCVGESLEEREAGRTDEVVETQVRGSLAGLTPEQLGALVVAYEPVWAIGTGRTAQPEDANAVIALIRRLIAGIGGAAAGEQVRIQYGGSVNEGNIADIMAQPEIDGALVGGASLDAEKFALIVRYRD